MTKIATSYFLSAKIMFRLLVVLFVIVLFVIKNTLLATKLC